ncbi:MAG: hypothetical protein ACD_76C00003G0001 [uncultured bacterium]|nr:MAG: hypothetical protein ACD_76C00003G0001 [uncultured bacterium]
MEVIMNKRILVRMAGSEFWRKNQNAYSSIRMLSYLLDRCADGEQVREKELVRRFFPEVRGQEVLDLVIFITPTGKHKGVQTDVVHSPLEKRRQSSSGNSESPARGHSFVCHHGCQDTIAIMRTFIARITRANRMDSAIWNDKRHVLQVRALLERLCKYDERHVISPIDAFDASIYGLCFGDRRQISAWLTMTRECETVSGRHAPLDSHCIGEKRGVCRTACAEEIEFLDWLLALRF